MTEIERLEENRKQLVERLASMGLTDMRRGSLLERYIPCGKPQCHCHQPGQKGHGPVHSLTYKVNGKTKTEYIRRERVHQVKAQLSTHQKFVELFYQLLDVNEQICRLRLVAVEAGEAKKNLKRRSTRKRPKRSTEY